MSNYFIIHYNFFTSSCLFFCRQLTGHIFVSITHAVTSVSVNSKKGLTFGLSQGFCVVYLYTHERTSYQSQFTFNVIITIF